MSVRARALPCARTCKCARATARARRWMHAQCPFREYTCARASSVFVFVRARARARTRACVRTRARMRAFVRVRTSAARRPPPAARAARRLQQRGFRRRRAGSLLPRCGPIRTQARYLGGRLVQCRRRIGKAWRKLLESSWSACAAGMGHAAPVG